jgi:hypothetical protein
LEDNPDRCVKKYSYSGKEWSRSKLWKGLCFMMEPIFM